MASELEAAIVAGAYRPGDQLPSEVELCAAFAVSRATIRDAIGRLEARGLLTRRRGSGTYVAVSPHPGVTTLLQANLSITEMIEQTGLAAGTSHVSVAYEVPPVEAVTALGLGASDAVFVVRRVRTADGVPAVFSVDYLPLSIADLPRDAAAYYGSLYALLAEACGEPVAGALARLEPLAAGGDVAVRLELEPGALLLALHQTHELRSGRRVLYSTDYLRSDIFTIYVRRLHDGRPETDAHSGDRSNPTHEGGTP